MKMISVTSSYLNTIGYDEHTMTLEIEFAGGKTFQYLRVPIDKFDGLRAADSKGRYFRKEIKGQYETEEVENFS